MMTALILGLLALSVLSLLAAAAFLYRWVVRRQLFPQLPKHWKNDRQLFVICAAAFVVFTAAFIAVGMMGGPESSGPDPADPTTPAEMRPTGPSFDPPLVPSPYEQPPAAATQPQTRQESQAQSPAQPEQPSAPKTGAQEPPVPDPDAEAPAAPHESKAAAPPAAPQASGEKAESLTGSYSAGPKEAAPAPETPAQTQAKEPGPPPAPAQAEAPKAEAEPKPEAETEAGPKAEAEPSLPSGKVYGVCVASFRKRSSADQKAAELKKQGYTTRIIPAKVKGKQWYRCCVGTFKEIAKAKAQADRIRKKTKYKSAFVTRIK